MAREYILAAAAANTDEGKVEAIARQFGWHPQLFFSQLVVFGIVVFALNKFAYKPILQVLDERRKRIEESLASAEKNQDGASRNRGRTQKNPRESKHPRQSTY